MPLDLEDELGRLYGVSLDEFVRERTRVARALRAEGRRAEAVRVQELRKPSVTVWAVNQLARRQRKDVDLLLDAGHRLAAAQLALLGGGETKAFEEARRREQAALKRLRPAARTILGERSSAGTLDRVVATLRAAAVSEEHREELARGRLTDEIGPAGFEAFASLRPGTAPMRAQPDRAEQRAAPRPAKSEARAEQEAIRREAITRARTRLKAAGEREAALAKQVRAAERAVRQAQQQLKSAERGLQRLTADRAAAARAVEEARQELESTRTRS